MIIMCLSSTSSFNIHAELDHLVRLASVQCSLRYFINLCQEIHSGPAGCPSGATVCRTLASGKTEVLGRVYTQEMNRIGGSRRQNKIAFFFFLSLRRPTLTAALQTPSPRRQGVGQLLGRGRRLREQREGHHRDRAELRLHGGTTHALQVNTAPLLWPVSNDRRLPVNAPSQFVHRS